MQKQSIPVLMDENKNPIAIIHRDLKGNKIIYLTHKADEDEIMALFENKSPLIKNEKGTEE